MKVSIRMLLTVLLMPFVAPALADGPASGYWHDMGWGMGGMFFGSLMMFVVWGGLIALVVLAVRVFTGNSTGGSGSNRAREILEERFAQGEIDKEEFEERKRLLAR